MTTIDHKRATFIPGPTRLTFRGILRSESIKLISLRSNRAMLVSIVLLSLAVSLALAVTMADAGVPDLPSVGFMLDEITLGTVLFGQLVAVVLGVMAISGEYASGSIQPTMIAVPTRTPVLLAKACVVFVAATATGLVGAFGSWAVTLPFFDALGLAVGLTAPGVLPALVGAAVYLGLSAILGLGIGALLRAVAPSVAGAVVLTLLMPVVLSALPASQTVRNMQLLTMSKAGDAMSNAPENQGALVNLVDGYISWGAGWMIAAAWALVFLVLGILRLRKGDV
ncbi:ABC transporter permease subunit [Microbacterium sp. NPDC089987]|uniref:ABC transporter permease subunit n=1 Tax=Microbacterium sp. NPDC089987 TaxID=3364202 RepID=UPI0038020F0B